MLIDIILFEWLIITCFFILNDDIKTNIGIIQPSDTKKVYVLSVTLISIHWDSAHLCLKIMNLIGNT